MKLPEKHVKRIEDFVFVIMVELLIIMVILVIEGIQR